MKNLIKLEELFLFVLGIFLFSQLDYAWWWFLVLLLAPDLGALGYLGGTKLGASTYNLVHHRGVALGVDVSSQRMKFAGVIIFSHTSLERVFGDGGRKSPVGHCEL